MYSTEDLLSPALHDRKKGTFHTVNVLDKSSN